MMTTGFFFAFATVRNAYNHANWTQRLYSQPSNIHNYAKFDTS